MIENESDIICFGQIT